ncbi:hypothetical protein OPKNFCMD_3811 [Methylobacterium crusticola]|uniref:Deoxynucleotide monophosphate kinase n=1 Tax=Methylobacterium crusticola TaxID=1697972 RepID=A0ABQ4R054_9HYPH|nr:deoxynucleotide monophosphate kinase [Methylobacterium crusticola]GJD51060.1 hypothetical protein OPKNFCMD_3811 [Methylobacterium crusticola]
MLTLPPVVALSGAAGAGKSTAAEILIGRHGYTRVKMAGPLKAMLRAIGLGDAEIEGDRKEVPCKLLMGATPRYAMIELGCAWGRERIHPDLWTHLWAHQACAVREAGGRVVCDDCRFLNEAAAVRELGGIVLRLRRPAVEGKITHASEAHAFTPDLHVWNEENCPSALAAELEGALRLLVTKRPA